MQQVVTNAHRQMGFIRFSTLYVLSVNPKHLRRRAPFSNIHLTPVGDHRSLVFRLVVLSSKTGVKVVKKRREGMSVERILVRSLKRSSFDLIRNISWSSAHVQLVFSALKSFWLAPTLRVWRGKMNIRSRNKNIRWLESNTGKCIVKSLCHHNLGNMMLAHNLTTSHHYIPHNFFKVLYIQM